MDLIQIFKDTMRNTGNTSESVAKLCNLNKYSVDNILQKRSNRFDYIVKIAEALDIPIFSSSYQNIENKIAIKTELYTISLDTVSKILAKKKNMIVTPHAIWHHLSHFECVL